MEILSWEKDIIADFVHVRLSLYLVFDETFYKKFVPDCESKFTLADSFRARSFSHKMSSCSSFSAPN
jgi:hypothetical protein